MNFVSNLTGGVIIGTELTSINNWRFPFYKNHYPRIGFYFSLEQNFINYLVDLFSEIVLFSLRKHWYYTSGEFDLNIVAS